MKTEIQVNAMYLVKKVGKVKVVAFDNEQVAGLLSGILPFFMKRSQL